MGIIRIATGDSFSTNETRMKVPVVCIPVTHIKYALTSHMHTGIIFEIYMYLETYTKSWRAAEQSKPNINRYVYKKKRFKKW